MRVSDQLAVRVAWDAGIGGLPLAVVVPQTRSLTPRNTRCDNLRVQHRGVLAEAGFLPPGGETAAPSVAQARRAKAAATRLARELDQERVRLQRAAATAAAELEDATAAVREATRLKVEVRHLLLVWTQLVGLN